MKRLLSLLVTPTPLIGISCAAISAKADPVMDTGLQDQITTLGRFDSETPQVTEIKGLRVT